MPDEINQEDIDALLSAASSDAESGTLAQQEVESLLKGHEEAAGEASGAEFPELEAGGPSPDGVEGTFDLLGDVRLKARIELVKPVQDNLARKLDAMEQALQAFEAAIDYGLSPVSTAATYHIASMYAELSRALLSSERPNSLSAEELAEYDALLGQQAAPFAQQAIELYSRNAQRPHDGPPDPWVEKSAQQLDKLQGR